MEALEKTLPHRSVKATFFVPGDRASLLASADLLRRVSAEGHQIGLLLPGQWEGPEQAAQAFEAANRTLKAVLMFKTRLVALKGGTSGQSAAVLDALTDRGCRIWEPTLRPTPPAAGQSPGTAFRRQMDRDQGTAVIGLGAGEAVPGLLSAALPYLESGNFALLTMTECDTPINQAGKLR